MMTRICFIVMLLVNGCTIVNSAERSISTSISGMEELLQTEEILLKSLNKYADELEQKLSIIRSIIKRTRIELKKAKPNIEAYLSNPLNAFSLIRRMHADWINVEYYLQKPIGFEHIKTLASQRLKLPTSADIVEAVNAIKRLQSTYDMKVADMAAGRLNGKQYDVSFSPLDSYTIGYELLKQTNHFDASYWIYVALQSFIDNDIYNALEFNKQKILELYAEVLVKQYRFQDALIVINKALEDNPSDINLIRRKTEIELQETINTKAPYVHSTPEVTDYQLGCRGNFSYPNLRNLHCRYNTTTNAFLKLAPIKMEEISLDPYMILFHDVISDYEIAHLKKLGRSNLKRATVYSETDKKSVIVKTRTSKFSWLNDNTTEITKRINQRIIDMTGYDIRGSEMLQVMNYGLGGHYDAHYDFFNFSMNAEVVATQGDRIATVLFYMSDVEQGGATVFPSIKVAVYPKKGSCIMWYNLSNRGVGDPQTMHAACPVVVGSKWVCNKWIRERNQFRTRPCPKE